MNRIQPMLLLGICASLCTIQQGYAQQNQIKGKLISPDGLPIDGAQVKAIELKTIVTTNRNGEFTIPFNADQTIHLQLICTGYIQQTIVYNPQKTVFVLQPYDRMMSTVEVFGHPNKTPDKLEALTGLPLEPNAQLQSVSVISSRLIREQDNQDISDALRNVTGVIPFSDFGGMGNAYTIRGIRGVTTLMNGIQVNNDSRGHGVTPDMQMIDNIQVLKGSSAIAQGLSNSIGSVGGIINAVTKTPQFINAGQVGIRYASWENVRGIYDYQHVASNKLAYRIDGAMEAGNGFRKYTKNDRFAINPSLTWKIDNQTTLIAEYAYQHDSRTPDRGTINLAADSVNGLWNMPNSKFLGFSSDHNLTDYNYWGLRLTRHLNKHFDFKINYYGSTYKQDFNSSIAALDSSAFNATGNRNYRYRYMNHVTENDKSNVINLALVGKNVQTGSIKHTFQIGFDFRHNDWYSQAFNSNPIDTINVFDNFTNILSNQNLTYKENKGRFYDRHYSTYGVYGQDMITFNKYVRALVGARYSHTNSLDNKTNTYGSGHSVDPIAGIFITPIHQLNFFGSYTTINDISTAEYIDQNGKKLGNMITHQYEFGLKSQYFHDRLRFNFTYFVMNNNDYAYQLTNTSTGNSYYNQSGSLKRKGIETEVAGHILDNLEVMLGYTHLNAKYEGVKSYVDGSEPMGTAKNTANGWINYGVNRGALKGLSLGVGAYYMGARPVDDYAKSTSVNIANGGGEIQKITPGVSPFMLNAFTTVNAQMAYSFKQYTFRAILNNIGNVKGYTAYYPQAFLTPSTPRNFAVSFYYSF